MLKKGHMDFLPVAPVRVFTNRKNKLVVREDTNHGTEINQQWI